MGEVGAVNRYETLEWQGRKLRLERPNYLTEQALTEYLQMRAYDAFERKRGRISLVAYREAVGAWERDCAAGVYDFGTETTDRAINNPQPFAYFIWLVLTQVQEQAGLSQEDVANLCREQRDTVVAAWNRLMSPTPTTPPEAPGASGSTS